MGSVQGHHKIALTLRGQAARAPTNRAPAWLGAFFGVGSIILFPIVYGIMGFIGGLITAVLYNLLAGFVGGIEMELQ